ncbi:universal stress protein [Saccharomonospora sp. NPDC006951]
MNGEHGGAYGGEHGGEHGVDHGLDYGMVKPRDISAQPIVAGVDGSAAALAAVRWAAREAARIGATLRLTHSCDLPPLNPGLRVAPPPEYASPWAESGRAWLADAHAAATAEAPGIDVDWDVCFGGAADTLVDESGTASLLVVGARGLGGFLGQLAGSVAVTAAAHARCPAVVVREDTVADVGPVVVGADGSPLSEQALEFGFEAASARGARLLAVRVWDDPFTSAEWDELVPGDTETPAPPASAVPTVPMARAVTGAAAVPDRRDSVAGREARALHADLVGWRDKYPDVAVHELAVRGNRAADGLLGAAAHAQLLVVGSHARGVVAGALLGSVSRELLRRSACPVAIVRPRH